MSALDDHLKKHRQKIINREENTFREMLSAYQEIENELADSYDDLQQKIKDAQAKGEEISPSWFYREKRLKRLLAQVTEQISRFGSKAAKIIKREQRAAIDIAISQAAETYNLLVETDDDAPGFVSMNPRTVETAVGMMGDGSPILEYFQQQLAPMVAERIKSEVIKAAAIGTDFNKIAKRLQETGDITKHRALSVARTEVNRVRRETTRMVYEENNDIIEGWEWVASKSLRTCPLCLAMDGKQFKLDEPFPQHINCRCTMISVIIGLPRRKRTIGKEWFESQTDETKSKILGKETFAAYNDHGLTLDDFVAFKNDKRFGKSVTRKPLAKILADKGIDPNGKTPKQPAQPKQPKAEKTKPAKIAIPEFKNVKDAQKWIEAKYPNIQFDFSQTKLETIVPTIKEFVRLSEAFPEVNNRLQYFGTYRDKTKKFHTKNGYKFRGEIAHASVDGKRIGLNPNIYNKPEAMQKALTRAKDSNFLVSDKIESPFTHEFGHQVEHWLQSVQNHSLTDIQSNSDKFAFKQVLDKFYNVFHKDLTYKSPENYKDWKVRNDALIKDVSRYGVSKKAELWAESFSAITHRPESKRAQLLERFLNEIKTIKLNPAPKEFRNASEAERKKAEKDLANILKKFDFLDEFN